MTAAGMHSANTISKTISVCSAKDLATWLVSSKYIIENIISNRYIVIVPKDDVEIFEKFSPKKFQVMNEEILISSFSEILRSKFQKENLYRYGWYLQQFIKLAALDMANDDEIFLIWDADTVPLKKISFIDDGKIGYYIGTENHTPYFDLILLMTGLPKLVNYSFIAQSFPVKGKWFRSFKKFIEDRHGLPWAEVLLNCIDFKQPSGFSEYETLGTFLSHNYAEEIYVVPNKWFRRGNSLIGTIKNIETPISRLMLRPYDFVSFEGWDQPSVSSRARALYACIIDSAT